MTHPHTTSARNDKAAQAAILGITEDRISDLVETFYQRIRADALLGPIFAGKITEWPVHLSRMKDFWASIAIESGRFHGNPMVKHIAIPGIEQKHFDHWLQLFNQTLPEIFSHPEARKFLSERASRIADSLMTGISIHRQELPVIPQNRSKKKEKHNVRK